MTTTQTSQTKSAQQCLLAFAAPVHELLEITPCRLQLVSTDPALRVMRI